MILEEEFNQDSSKNNKVVSPSIEEDFKSKEAIEKIWVVVNAIQVEKEISSKKEVNFPIWYSYQTLSGNGKLSGDSVVRILGHLERDKKVIEILEIKLGDEFINLEELRKLEGDKKALKEKYFGDNLDIEAWTDFGENKNDEVLIKTLPGFEEFYRKLNITFEKKKYEPRFPHKIPPGTKWEDVKMYFIDGHTLAIKIPDVRAHKETYEGFGFIDKRTKKPNKNWEFLRELAMSKGEIDWRTPFASLKLKKRKSLVAKKLKEYFRSEIEGDPFYSYKKEKSYKAKFQIYPEGYQDPKKYFSPKELEELRKKKEEEEEYKKMIERRRKKRGYLETN